MTTATNRPQIAVIVGSNRRDSINRKLAQALVKLGAGKFDATFVRIDDLPMYNQDNEGNLPAEVARFKDEIARGDGVLIVTPEHNRSIPTVLKNAVDWGARPYGKSSWIGKTGFITGTSPGAIGSALAQQHLRSVMTGLGMTLLGGEAYITFKPNLIDDHGHIGDDSTQKFLQGFVDRFAALVARLAPATDDATRALTEDEVGVAVMCAAMGRETALEKDGNGLFTRAVLDALASTKGVFFNPSDHRLYTHHLQAFVFDEVSRKSGGRQHPFLSLPWVVQAFPVAKVAAK